MIIRGSKIQYDVRPYVPSYLNGTRVPEIIECPLCKSKRNVGIITTLVRNRKRKARVIYALYCSNCDVEFMGMKNNEPVLIPPLQKGEILGMDTFDLENRL
ncbi:MAG: hypothetical protein H0Z24_06985 [Thermosipho sp. (in: Bacteria)]|nr:hypothetical protein [Thermosipho sp. (in: thermotogales)]